VAGGGRVVGKGQNRGFRHGVAARLEMAFVFVIVDLLLSLFLCLLVCLSVD